MQAAKGDPVQFNAILDQCSRSDLERALDEHRKIEIQQMLQSGWVDKRDAKKLQREYRQLLSGPRKPTNPAVNPLAAMQRMAAMEGGMRFGQPLPHKPTRRPQE